LLFELCFFHKDSGWGGVLEYLKKFPSAYQVVTTSYSLNQFLKSNGIDSKTFLDIFPEEGDNSYEVYKRSKQIQSHYRRFFDKVNFAGISVFDGFEHSLLTHIILHEKVRSILQANKNTILILEEFSFSYFSIVKLAKELGYECDLKICRLHKGKTKFIRPDDDLALRKLYYYNILSTYFPRRPHIQEPDQNMAVVTSSDFDSRFPNMVSTLSRHLLGKAVARISAIFHLDISRWLFPSIKAEIQKKGAANARCVFFLTTNEGDLYLKAIYPILDKLKEKGIACAIFVTDPITADILSKRKIPFVNLFHKANLMMHTIGAGSEGKNIIKSFSEISKENDLSLLYTARSSKPTPLFHMPLYIYRACAMVAICEYIVKLIRPQSAIIATDGTNFGNCAVNVCAKNGIPTFFVPSTIINSNPLHADWIGSDKICMYGQQGLKVLSSLGYSEERIVLTGNPKYDFLKTFDKAKSRQALSSYSIDGDKKLIVVAMARWHKGDEVWMSRLVKFCNKHDIEVVIKVHPMYKSILSFDESQDRIKLIAKECQGLKYLVTYDIDIYTLISAADLVITEYSNVGAEALLMDRPVLTVNFNKEPFENEQRYHETGAAIYLEEYSEMEQVVLDMLVHGKYLDELREGRKRAADLYNYYNDGRAAERVLDLITDGRPKA
jgi:hypothetical protein